MKTPGLQVSLTSMLLLVACAAGNLWLFRQGVIWGILGLNVTKHVATAYLCKALGVNGPDTPPPMNEPASPTTQ